MNSNKKFDFYKNSLYFLIANACLIAVAIIITAIFGFNYAADMQAGRILFQSSLSIIISLALITLYVGFRYDFGRALNVVLVAVHNVLLSTAFIGIIRVPISEMMVAGFVLLVGISAVFTLILTENLKDVNYKKADYKELVKNSLNSNVKKIAVINAVLIALLFLSLIVSSTNLYNFARLFFVMLIVMIYNLLTTTLPICIYFGSKIKKVKKPAVDQNVENQKVVKAVATEGGDDENLQQNN